MWRAFLRCWWWRLSGLCSSFTVRPHAWLLYISTGLTMVLQSFSGTCSLILFFLIQILLFRLWRTVVGLTFHFAEEIVDQQHDLFMGSLNVDFLFTNIPLEKTIEICTSELFKESSDLVKFLVCYSVGTFHTYHPLQLFAMETAQFHLVTSR